MKYTHEEQETFIHYDYPAKKLIISSTFSTILRHFKVLLKDLPDITIGDNFIEIPLKYARKPWMVLSKPKIRRRNAKDTK